MLERDFQKLIEMSDRQNALYYGWLRQILTLAVGALSVLVSFHAGAGSTGIALAFLRLTWLTGGLGILAGAVAAFGETHQARGLVKARRQQIESVMKQTPTGGTYPGIGPTVVKPAWWMQYSATLCTTSLTIAVVLLVGFALLRE